VLRLVVQLGQSDGGELFGEQGMHWRDSSTVDDVHDEPLNHPTASVALGIAGDLGGTRRPTYT
jgi:hypothetical protein